MEQAKDVATAELPDDWEINGPTQTTDGWRASARPRRLIKRLSGRADGYGDTPEEALRNLASALRDFSDDDLRDGT